MAAPAPPPATDTDAPQVTIETVGPARKRLTITVSTTTINRKLEESLGTLAGEAVLPGFRKGKIPRRLLERRFGDTVRNEAKNQLMADAYAKAIEEHKIEPVGEPEAPNGLDLKIEDGKPLTFSLEVEVVPEFELPNLEGVEIRKPTLPITEDHVERELRRHLERLGTPHRIDSGFQPGDRVSGHLSITKQGDEKPIVEADQVVVLVPGPENGGRGIVAGLIVEGLAEKLAALRVGDTLNVEIIGPEAHEIEAIRGATLQIAYRIAAGERIEPASVQAMIDRYALGTQENLRQQVRLALEHQRDTEQAAAMREQISQHLLKTVEIELPEKLSAAQAARNLEGHRVELLYRNVPPDEIESRLAAIRTDTEEQTRNRLKLFFLMRRLGDQLGVQVSEQEVNGRVAEIAAQQGQRPEQLKAELSRTGRLGEILRMVREHKTADRLIEKAKVTEIAAEEWNELVKQAPDAPGGARGRTPAARVKTAADKPADKETAPPAAKKSAGKSRAKKGTRRRHREPPPTPWARSFRGSESWRSRRSPAAS